MGMDRVWVWTGYGREDVTDLPPLDAPEADDGPDDLLAGREISARPGLAKDRDHPEGRQRGARGVKGERGAS